MKIRKLRAILDAADRRINEGEGIRHEEFWRRVETRDRSRANGGGKKSRTKG